MDSSHTRIQSLSEFVIFAAQLRNDWFPNEKSWGPWFRGHSNADWSLKPNIYRVRPPDRGLRIIEDEIRQEFVVRGPSLTHEIPQNSWEWYFLMQHSGAPTRLLDWTESALIALYFAVRDRQDRDAAVWAIDPWWLNKEVIGEREVIPPGATKGLFETDASRYELWLPDRFDAKTQLEERPVAVYPTHMARRISTQRSCFTVHGSNPDGLEKLRSVPNAHLTKCIIPFAVVSQIEEELAVAGIDEISIYPDLDGLGRCLSTVLRDESGPTKIEFRKANVPDELDALCEFDRKVFHAYPADWFPREEWADFESFWMIADGITVGCSSFLHGTDYNDQPRPDCLFIVSTGVLPEFRRLGFGKQQKKWQIDYAKQHGFQAIVTNARQSNESIIRLNLKLGFKIRDIDRDYYDDPDEPAIVMELQLGTPLGT